MKPRPRRVSGRLIAVAVMSLGVAVGAVGVWWMTRARPSPGAYIDVLALGGDAAVAVRHEHGGARSFVELIDGGAVRWNALVPPYADPPRGVALAASADAITVRVVRGGLPEVFALDARDAAKLGGIHLALGRPPHRTGYTLPTVATVMAGGFAIEVIGDEGAWAEMVAIRQSNGTPAWRRALGAERVGDVVATADALRVDQGGASTAFDLATGEPLDGPAPPPAPPRIAFDPASRVATALDQGVAIARVRWPAAARPPQRHHAAQGAVWMVLPDRLVLLDPRTLTPLKAVGGPVPALEALPVR